MSEEARAAVAMLVCNHPEPAALLIRRAMRDDDPWSDHWAFPGGRIERNETVVEAAARECMEEVGYRPDPAGLAERLPDAHAGRSVARPIRVGICRWQLAQRPDLRADQREVAGLYWLPLSMIDADPIHLAQVLPQLQAPAIALNDGLLWGFTLRVLCDWRGRALPDLSDGKAADRIGS